MEGKFVGIDQAREADAEQHEQNRQGNYRGPWRVKNHVEVFDAPPEHVRNGVELPRKVPRLANVFHHCGRELCNENQSPATNPTAETVAALESSTASGPVLAFCFSVA